MLWNCYQFAWCCNLVQPRLCNPRLINYLDSEISLFELINLLNQIVRRRSSRRWRPWPRCYYDYLRYPIKPIYIYIYTCVYIYITICICVCVYVYLYLSLYTYIYIYIHHCHYLAINIIITICYLCLVAELAAVAAPCIL